MEQFEKVEKLAARANVSFEDAKTALEAADWDMLDAMVYLEKSGKTSGPARASHVTGGEYHEENITPVEVIVEEQKKKNDSGDFGKKVKHFFEIFWDKIRSNSFVIKRKEEEILRVPGVFMLVLLLLFWKVLPIVLIVALFFGCRYSIQGKDNMDKANKVMDKAGDIAEEVADKIKSEYDKL